jgi:hypothetical protein
MIGYGEMPWHTTSSSGLWPLISLAPQKSTVNLYIAAEKNGESLPSYYLNDFEKTAVGKLYPNTFCKSLKKDTLISLIKETVLWADVKGYK